MKPLEWTTEKRKVNDLIELEINPRKITEKKKAELVASLDKFNLVEIPAINTDNKLIAGNRRLKVLQLAGRGEELIDVHVPNRKLTLAELKEYAIISNSHSGEWDFDLLQIEFADIDMDFVGLDMKKIEFEQSPVFDKQMDTFFARKEAKILKAEDDGFETPITEPKTDILPGDIFEIGNHRLMCGDSTKAINIKQLLNNEMADLIFTDPPYDLEDSYSANIFDAAKEDSHIFIMNSDKLLVQIVNTGYNWFRKFFAVDFRQARLVSNNQPMTRVDLIAEFCKGKTKFVNKFDGFSTLIECSKIHNDNEDTNFGHKQAKRIELPATFIEHYSTENDLVVDFFGGSGSTMAACQQLNRRCYMMEFDPANCQIILDRMQDVYKINYKKISNYLETN